MEIDLETIINSATDEQFNQLLEIAKDADPSGELHDRFQFYRQMRHNPAFREAVAAEVRRVNGLA